MLAANAISSWLGGSGNPNASTSSASTPQGTGNDTTTGASQASQSGEAQGRGTHEAPYEDDGGWFGGGDDLDV
jgi:hypothetical protein